MRVASIMNAEIGYGAFVLTFYIIIQALKGVIVEISDWKVERQMEHGIKLKWDDALEKLAEKSLKFTQWR